MNAADGHRRPVDADRAEDASAWCGPGVARARARLRGLDGFTGVG